MTKATVENPVVLGSEGSGTIEAIPEGETSFQVGQKAAGGKSKQPKKKTARFFRVTFLGWLSDLSRG